MASLAPHPHPPVGIHSTLLNLSAPSPKSCPQPPQQPPSPRPLAALTIPPLSNESTPTPTNSNATVRAAPVAPVYRSMCDIDTPAPRKSKTVSNTPSVTSQISSSSNSQSASSNLDYGEFSLSPIETTPTNLPSQQMNNMPDLATDKALPRATTSPNLNAMAAPAAPQRPPPAPLSSFHRMKSTTNKGNTSFSKNLPDIPPPSPASSSRRHSQIGTPLTSGASTPKEGFIKRATSFLHSSKKNRNSFPDSTVSMATNTQSSVSTQKTNFKSNGSSSPSAHSPATSLSGTPPSPRSREGTILEYDEIAPDQQVPPELEHIHHSASSSNMLEHAQTANAPRVGITWGPNFTDDGLTVDMPMRPRRRSISQDNINLGFRKKERDPDAPVDLIATFSYRSMEGVGLKARRLSTALPDDFHVDFSDLNKEFAPSSHLPFGRGKTVGKGATAIVKLMHRKGDAHRMLYAVKEYRGRDKSEPEQEYVKKVKSEYSIAHSLQHPNIVRSVALCTYHGRWNNVMEYCSFGELYHWVEKGLFKSHFKLADRNCFFKQLLRGVDYLHSHGIAHRDIKLENLLLTAEGHLKITDFGVSDVFSGEHPGLREAQGQCGRNMGSIRRCAPGICGSLPYIAPEVLEKKGDYDPRALDVWSCAIVYLTMTYGGGPWNEARTVDQMYSRFLTGWKDWYETHPDGEITDAANGTPRLPGMFSGKHPAGLTATSSPAMRRLILKMLNPRPGHRIDMHSVVNSSLIKGIECCTSETCEEDGKCHDKQASDCSSKAFKKSIIKKHSHIPPKEHKTPGFFKHRFDMGDGY